jgi:hypothetical protein
MNLLFNDALKSVEKFDGVDEYEWSILRSGRIMEEVMLAIACGQSFQKYQTFLKDQLKKYRL